MTLYRHRVSGEHERFGGMIVTEALRMGGLDELLRMGAPWWVVGLFLIAIVAVAAKGIVSALKATADAEAPRTKAAGADETSKQKIEINIRTGPDGSSASRASEENRGTDNPFERVHRPQGSTGKSTLAEELALLKGPDDEVYVNDIPPQKS